MLFIFGGRDRIVPAMEMAANLERLSAAPDKDIEVIVFPNAEHALMDADSVLPRLAPGYVDAMLSWLLDRVSAAQP